MNHQAVPKPAPLSASSAPTPESLSAEALHSVLVSAHCLGNQARLRFFAAIKDLSDSRRLP